MNEKSKNCVSSASKWIWLERTTKIMFCASLLFNFGYMFSHTRLDEPNILNQTASPEWYRNGAIIFLELGFLLLVGTIALKKQKTSLSCFVLAGLNLLMLCLRQ